MGWEWHLIIKSTHLPLDTTILMLLSPKILCQNVTAVVDHWKCGNQKSCCNWEIRSEIMTLKAMGHMMVVGVIAWAWELGAQGWRREPWEQSIERLGSQRRHVLRNRSRTRWDESLKKGWW